MTADPQITHDDPRFEHARASQLLRILADSHAEAAQITIGEMMQAFGERAFGLLMILFCLPNLIPLPGIGSLFGIPLIFVTLQMAFGRKSPWLPSGIAGKAMEGAALKKMVDAVEPRMQRIEGVLRPRWTFLFSPFMDRAIGVFATLCAISIIIPFPGTNFPPAVGLILISLAVTAEDGLYLCLGTIIGFLGLTYTTIVVGGLAYAGWLALVASFGF
jgi:hypothetical protein